MKRHNLISLALYIFSVFAIFPISNIADDKYIYFCSPTICTLTHKIYVARKHFHWNQIIKRKIFCCKIRFFVCENSCFESSIFFIHTEQDTKRVVESRRIKKKFEAWVDWIKFYYKSAHWTLHSFSFSLFLINAENTKRYRQIAFARAHFNKNDICVCFCIRFSPYKLLFGPLYLMPLVSVLYLL